MVFNWHDLLQRLEMLVFFRFSFSWSYCRQALGQPAPTLVGLTSWENLMGPTSVTHQDTPPVHHRRVPDSPAGLEMVRNAFAILKVFGVADISHGVDGV